MKSVRIIVLVLFCGNINGVEQEKPQLLLGEQKQQQSNPLPLDSYDVLIKQLDNSKQDISLPESKHVSLGIYRADQSTVNVYIPLPVEKVTMHINRIDNTTINLYAWHNPIIERNTQKADNSNISNVMLPPRKYPYRILALATLAAGAWWLSSEKK